MGGHNRQTAKLTIKTQVSRRVSNTTRLLRLSIKSSVELTRAEHFMITPRSPAQRIRGASLRKKQFVMVITDYCSRQPKKPVRSVEESRTNI
jgi:hypothetical protein